MLHTTSLGSSIQAPKAITQAACQAVVAEGLPVDEEWLMTSLTMSRRTPVPLCLPSSFLLQPRWCAMPWAICHMCLTRVTQSTLAHRSDNCHQQSTMDAIFANEMFRLIFPFRYATYYDHTTNQHHRSGQVHLLWTIGELLRSLG